MNKIINIKSFLLLALLLTQISSNILLAHDGPVDRKGCHSDSKGRWHCH